MVIDRNIYISAALSEIIWQESQEKFPLETGGILIGRFEESGIVIVHVVGPGPCAMHEPTRFVRDGEYTQQKLDSYVGAYGSSNDYVGEWHSHPLPIGPSSRDKDSMYWISNSDAYNCVQPVLILCQRTKRRDWALRGYVWANSKLNSLPVIVINAK